MDEDFVLRWPRALFKAQTADLLNRRQDLSDWSERCELLLEDVFTTTTPLEEFQRLREASRTGEWGEPAPNPFVLTPEQKWLADLLARADSIQYVGFRRPYYTERLGGRLNDQISLETAGHEFDLLVSSLTRRGYLEQVFGKDCPDDPSDVNPADVIASLHPGGDLWPIDRAALARTPGDFLDLIEVLHDLVSAPRRRRFHDWSGCGWHYHEFSPSIGRAVYRWSVNRILDRTTLGLRLAEEGEDRGRLVAVTDRARSDLADRMVSRQDESTSGVVRHAIALFRGRGVTEHDKRSACTALARVLEERRRLLEDKLAKKDEGDLFLIANRFAIRHQNAQQQKNYDPLFLDWVFWFYLATIELSDGLIARDEGLA
ncbi:MULTISPECIES: hypothetical protein [unclassified Knoellia]|uniref:hypothetical protein n=1 Tax=Knoellia altitudinis TaxID=3404795 RepID=UPI003621D9CD